MRWFKVHLWNDHPGVRSGNQLSLGERAADILRNGMGSWAFVFGALIFLAIWMLFNGTHGFDAYPFILLNLVLSCLAALQGAILLIAAKRQDQVASELAQHDLNTDIEAHDLIVTMVTEHALLSRKLSRIEKYLGIPDVENIDTTDATGA